MRPMRAIGAAVLALVVGCGGGGGKLPPAAPEAGGAAGKPAALGDLKGKVTAIDVVGVSGQRVKAVRDALGSAVGQDYDARQVARDIASVWRVGGLADVQVQGRPAGGGVALRFVVTEQPKVRSVDVRGAHAITAEQFLAQMPIHAGSSFDPVAANRVRRDIGDAIRDLGYPSVAVKQDVKRAADGSLDLAFVVDEGPHVVVSKIDFVGTKALARPALLDTLGKNGGTTIGGRYSRHGLEDGLLHIQMQYYDSGYVLSQIEEPDEKLSADKSSMEITVKITEGNQFRIGKLEVKGELAAPEADYLKALGLKKGDVFSRSKVTEGMKRIVDLHKSKGKPEPQVEPVTNIDAKEKKIDLAIEIGAGGPGPGPAAPGAGG